MKKVLIKKIVQGVPKKPAGPKKKANFFFSNSNDFTFRI